MKLTAEKITEILKTNSSFVKIGNLHEVWENCLENKYYQENHKMPIERLDGSIFVDGNRPSWNLKNEILTNEKGEYLYVLLNK